MDIFMEQLTKKPLKKVDYILFFAIVAFIILEVLFNIFALNLGVISLPIAAISVCICLKLINFRFMEFEYIITNGNITIDKITARRSRKNIVSFELDDVYKFIKYRKDTNLSGLKKIYHLQTDGEAWCACFYDNNLGRVGVIFSPNEKFLNAIKPSLKRQVTVDAFGGN